MRLGKLTSTGEFVRDVELWGAFCKEMHPVELTWDYNHFVHITAISKHFDEVREGAVIPCYEAIFEGENGKCVFKRVEKK